MRLKNTSIGFLRSVGLSMLRMKVQQDHAQPLRQASNLQQEKPFKSHSGLGRDTTQVSDALKTRPYRTIMHLKEYVSCSLNF